MFFTTALPTAETDEARARTDTMKARMISKFYDRIWWGIADVITESDSGVASDEASDKYRGRERLRLLDERPFNWVTAFIYILIKGI